MPFQASWDNRSSLRRKYRRLPGTHTSPDRSAKLALNSARSGRQARSQLGPSCRHRRCAAATVGGRTRVGSWESRIARLGSEYGAFPQLSTATGDVAAYGVRRGRACSAMPRSYGIPFACRRSSTSSGSPVRPVEMRTWLESGRSCMSISCQTASTILLAAKGPLRQG